MTKSKIGDPYASMVAAKAAAKWQEKSGTARTMSKLPTSLEEFKQNPILSNLSKSELVSDEIIDLPNFLPTGEES